ncbi:hypothetical protein [Desulfuromonas sp. DDH964]|nr:hypothetical protein [Desulfuromonas sp. DDH964]AMV72247.1 hypothetical protein DBW_1894 [Desulfuromonas sp. DDH964]
MKRLTQTVTLALALLVLAACSSVVGGGSVPNARLNHQTQIIGPAADGP